MIGRILKWFAGFTDFFVLCAVDGDGAHRVEIYARGEDADARRAELVKCGFANANISLTSAIPKRALARARHYGPAWRAATH